MRFLGKIKVLNLIKHIPSVDYKYQVSIFIYKVFQDNFENS